MTSTHYSIRLFAFLILVYVTLCSSCAVIEKSSRHGFESGYYKMKSYGSPDKDVYLDMNDNEVTVYPKNEEALGNELINISLSNSDTLCHISSKFVKKSLDIDITTVLLKFRPSVYDLPSQMNIDFNAALYAGWRHDTYFVKGKADPLHKCRCNVVSRGYDFGIFTGLGSATIGPFSTRNAISNEYDGMVLQFGIAGFVESNFASFGISTGYDYLFSRDRDVWIYNYKPWIGLIIGFALN